MVASYFFRAKWIGLFALLFTCQPAHAQSVFVKGIVLDNAGKPVSDAYVILGSNTYYDVTNNNGQFEISGIKQGRYILTTSRIGYQTVEKQIEINEGDITGLQIVLKPKSYQSETIVVTATRTRKDLEEVPVPITVINKEEINSTSSMRLSDVLAEQTGLTLVSDHGTGVQVQGFDSEYTLIMLDGQPLIGRTAGTFDLSRITVGNIKQIEMMKGPSSSLWGSDAMAGVINIITEEGKRPFELGITSRFGTNQTLDLGTNVSWNQKGWQNDLFFNRNNSGGYRLVPGSISQTVPEYQNYTGSYRTEWDLNDRISLELHGRYYRESQQSTDFIGSRDNPTLLNEEAIQEDYSLSPSLHVQVSPLLKIDVEYYTSGYQTERTFKYQNSRELYQRDMFDQTYNKSEVQATLFWNDAHISTAGSGVNWERLTSERYIGQPDFRNIFVFGQHEWLPTEELDIIAGFRYDTHSEYADQFSPKLSARYKVRDWLHFRASAGKGFKAPAFRQLFLNFTNPTVGYSVFGSSTVQEQIRRLEQEGKISRILIPLDQLEEIKAERSWSYNAGFDIQPKSGLEFRVNLFRNNVDDLIEAAPIAQKTNGQSAFTYFNLEEVYTQGLETQLRWNPLPGLDVALGYQLLDARRNIERTKTVVDKSGQVVEKEVSSFKPMFNRSRHSGTLKIFYRLEKYDIDANLRGIWRGRYGHIDANGNGFVDSGEYEDGYTLWNTAVAKTFAERYKIQFGIDNIFDFIRPQELSYLPGRIYYAQVSLQLY